ncbi:chromate resistance protein ChrB domain-containing protein [Acidiphilium acidophilum]|uniref:chromate resistance protein ChrB domain-containing protein n=1 Tax=Acidiphilium acidophilum TaxID=76588 RepID=UPI002E8E77D8|nr:chromate resistance protein ChrB domain-containing protein [Acidiphilium acidophilum]
MDDAKPLNNDAAATAERWLLLIHQMPTNPAYARVKVWRRLQALGAVAVKSTVYVLPANEQTREDFVWLLREIIASEGEALICEAKLIDGLSDQEVRAIFNAARDADYAALAKETRELDEVLRQDPAGAAEIKGRLAKLKAKAAKLVALDFFGANGRETLDGLLSALETKFQGDAKMEVDAAPRAANDHETLKGRIWVTRQDVHVDRIACAWLIRRFIDPDAQFKFVAAKGYQPKPDELRFDMFEAEFTHEGDRCTFEVLMAKIEQNDPAIAAIAEVVHDIDLKDEKFGREEASGVRSLIVGLTKTHKEDEQRLVRGAALFDDLYESFRKKRR